MDKDILSILEKTKAAVLSADPKVPLTLGEKEYTLEFTMTACTELFKGTQINLLNFKGIDTLLNPTNLTAIIWAGLKTNHPNVKMSDVVNNMTLKGMPYYVAVVMVAIGLATPKKDTEEVEEQAGVDNPDVATDPIQ